MSGWTKAIEKSVEIIHHSTASVIQVKITSLEEVDWGKVENVTREFWLNYQEFSDLKEVINSVDFPS
jgi:plasmid maintenance system antidote protein VapI